MFVSASVIPSIRKGSLEARAGFWKPAAKELSSDSSTKGSIYCGRASQSRKHMPE
jgi:hypothetical protein